ncbi:Aste57867_23612 [Aphanomyces stellatus]|uniref:Aste57867_23612 protein n=1 Tax=Aphanomyces stellatus TaxID=120398 RepID=A0A485LNZ9_9STRA|nr:hypothetical protein As57867_023540 [Aphanomyces stellatus]VFU00257.1 Aste57867_23612 [Aphanomyces stellatus]
MRHSALQTSTALASVQEGTCPPLAMLVTTPSSFSYARFASVVVAIQYLWALSIPVRNIVVFPYPTFNYDISTTASTPFSGFDESKHLKFIGNDVLATIQEALAITLSNTDVRKHFEHTGTFAID